MVFEKDVEEFAKHLVTNGGAEPETLVQMGKPMIYGTPEGDAVMVNPGSEQPLWQLYVAPARVALHLAKEKLEGKLEIKLPSDLKDSHE
tara:strand:- start:4936 stop:5202 length:267 start_codon:yes stop_codon:yes gene_type:complete